MATYVITHEVDDVEHWLSSPKREEVFGPIGVTVRPFRDPEGSNKVALIAEIPDMNADSLCLRCTELPLCMESTDDGPARQACRGATPSRLSRQGRFDGRKAL